MDPPPAKPASPYNFGLGSDFEIALILPFLYFFSAVFPDIYYLPPVAPKPASLTESASPPHTCGLTPPDELLASLDQRRNTIGEQAATSLFLIVIICFASNYHDFKCQRSEKAMWYRIPLWTIWLENMDLSPCSLIKKLFPWNSDTIPPRDDYRMTQRREGIRLLFLVVISALLCPIANYLCGPGEGGFLSGRLDIWDMPLSLDPAKFTIPLIFVFLWFGAGAGVQMTMVISRITAPCVLTAWATVALAFLTFGRRHGVVDIWDRRVERWAEAWEKESFAASVDQWEIVWKRVDLGKSVEEAKDEMKMDERDKELLVWRKGMREGRGYGPDYWLPREKEDTDVRQRPFKYSAVAEEDADDLILM